MVGCTYRSMATWSLFRDSFLIAAQTYTSDHSPRSLSCSHEEGRPAFPGFDDAYDGTLRVVRTGVE